MELKMQYTTGIYQSRAPMELSFIQYLFFQIFLRVDYLITALYSYSRFYLFVDIKRHLSH